MNRAVPSTQMNNASRPRQGNKPDWKEAKRFVDGSYAVVVDVLEGYRPRYSLRCGRVRQDGAFTPNVGLQQEGTFQITLRDRPSKSIPMLIEKAEAWILEEMGFRFNEEIDRRIEREQKQANFGKKEVRVTGKTEKKKARRAGPSPA